MAANEPYQIIAAMQEDLRSLRARMASLERSAKSSEGRALLPRQGRLVPYKYSGAASGGGRYKAKTIIGDANPAAAGNLSESDVGVIATADDAVVWFVPEIGTSAHSQSGYGIGEYAGATSDGKWIIKAGGGGSGGLQYVAVVKTSGSAGDASTLCSFVYTVNTLDVSPVEIATGQSPAFQRSYGPKTEATKGIWDPSSGTLVTVDEVDGKRLCIPSGA